MERNCHLIDLHKVIMAVILTAIFKKIYTLYLTNPKPDSFRLVFIPFIQKLLYSVFYSMQFRICGWLSYRHQPVFPHSSGH